jgi:hypothetical protein
MNELHECDKKKGLIWEFLYDAAGRMYCRGCNKELELFQIEPKVLRSIGK